MSSYSSSILTRVRTRLWVIFKSKWWSLKSGSFSCGKSSRKTYFWLQNGPTQFHPDGNLFSSVYFRNRFLEIIDTSKLSSPQKLISRNHWYFEIKVIKTLISRKIDQIEKFLYFGINYCIHRCTHLGCSCNQHCDRNCEYQSNIRWYLRIQFPEIANSNPWNQEDTCRKIHRCDWCKWHWCDNYGHLSHICRCLRNWWQILVTENCW